MYTHFFPYFDTYQHITFDLTCFTQLIRISNPIDILRILYQLIEFKPFCVANFSEILQIEAL